MPIGDKRGVTVGMGMTEKQGGSDVLTRLDCMLASAAQMRMALAQAVHHATHRHATHRRTSASAWSSTR